MSCHIQNEDFQPQEQRKEEPIIKQNPLLLPFVQIAVHPLCIIMYVLNAVSIKANLLLKKLKQNLKHSVGSIFLINKIIA
jgi:hypothetical protein